MALERSRGIASQLTVAVPGGADDAIDWETLPVSLVLDTDFDAEDEEVVLGHARSMAFSIREEEDWF